MDDLNLSHAEKLTYALLSGLADDKGMCYPSNEWLEKKIGLKSRQITNILENLEKYTYIRREVIRSESDPFKVYRNIFVTHNFKKSLPDAKNCTPENAKNCTSDMQKIAPIISEEEVLISKDIPAGGKPPEPPPSPPKRTKQKKVPEQKTEVAPRVELTPSQVDALKKRLEGSNINPQATYDRLSVWKISKDIWGGSDFRTILAWVIDACIKDSMDKPSHPSPKAPNQASQAEITAKDRMLGREIMKRFVNLTRVELMNVGNDCIEFNLGDRGGNVKVRFGCAGFKDMCLKYLRQLNQDTSGL